MKSRRGFAMLAALWLVVAIAAVALQFSLDARERRQLGIDAAERGQGRAAALGAVTRTQARLEQALRQTPPNLSGALGSLRSADPLLDADSIWGGEVAVDSLPVEVRIRDLGAVINLNQANEAQLRAFFSFVLRNVVLSDQLSQRIMDWRDADTLARINGAEVDLYMKEGALVLPTNAPFRSVDELRHVLGMSPDLFELIRGYFTTHGQQQLVNLNSAPEPVLRAIPGMTDQIVMAVLSRRSGGRRIARVADVIPASAGGNAGRGGGGNSQNQALQRLTQMTTVSTQQLELTASARSGIQATPVVVTAVLQRSGSNISIQARTW